MDKMTQPMEFMYDIGAPLTIRMPVGQLMQGDNGANTLAVTLTDGKAPADLSGYTAVGEVRREDGVRVTFECKIIGNTITGTLNADCYAYPGDCTATIQLAKSDGFRRTVLLIGANVADRGDGPLIDGGNVVEDVAGVIAMMAEMRESNAESIAAAETANTAAANADAARENIQSDLGAVKDAKADAIMDTSARAASHELHAQDGRMHVTLYGATTETGTGDKSPENPYTISGVDAVDIRVGGKNLIPGWVDGHISSSTGGFHTPSYPAVRTDYIPIQPGKPYTFSGQPTDVFNLIALYDAEKKFVRRTSGDTTSPRVVKASETVGCYYAAIAQYLPDESVTGTPNTTTAQFEMGTEATLYEPYNANAYELPLLPDGAPLHGNGTVDDTIENDVPSGFDEEITFNGAESWRIRDDAPVLLDTRLFQTMLPRLKYTSGTGASNRFPNGSEGSALWNEANYEAFSMYYNDTDGAFIRVRSKAKNVEEFKAELAANPLRIKYRSAEYTPDKDLRVCRTVRRWREETVDTSLGTAMAFSVIGDCARASFRVRKNNANPSMGICDILPYKYNYNEDTEHAYVSTGYAYIFVKTTRLSEASFAGISAWVKENAPKFWYTVNTPEIYVTDAVEIRKPSGIMTVTVTGSGETSVKYPHDTKHYTDSQHDSLAKAVEQNAEAFNLLSEDIAHLTGEYELIKEITIEEDVTQMVILLELDGHLCDFTAVTLKIITEPTGESETNKHNFITIGDKPDYSKTVLRFAGMYHETYARYIACKIKVEGGKVWGTAVAATNNPWNEGAIMTSALQNGLIYAEKINALSVICGINSPIRKGTVITIEGVRAR